MNQFIMKKTLLASAISMSIASTYAIAGVPPDQLPITNMAFDGVVYNAGGFFNATGTIDPFNPGADLVNVPGENRREPVPTFDPATASGNIYSFDNFNGFPWEGSQQTTYFTNTDQWANCTDQCVSGSNKSSGPASAQGQYDYDDELAGMSDEQRAVGMFFNWNGNNQIAVLDVFNCDANDVCTGTGIKMQNGPFSDSRARFNAGITCNADDYQSLTEVDTPVSIDIVEDVLGNASTPANCVNPTATAPKNNPAGLKVVSVISPTTEGGTVVINGGFIDYTPPAGTPADGSFEGPDTFVINITDDTGQFTAPIYTVQVGGQLQSNFTMLDVNGGIIGGTNDVDIEWEGSGINSDGTLIPGTYSNPAIIPGSDNGDGFGIPADTTSVMTIESPTPFKGFNWFAQNVRVYQGPIMLKFDIACTEQNYTDGTADCNANPIPPLPPGNTQRYIMMDLEAGEIGGHMIFHWGKDDPTTTCGLKNCAIDVINVWTKDAMWPAFTAGSGKNELYTGKNGIPPAVDANWLLASAEPEPGKSVGVPMVDGAFNGSNANFNYLPDKEGTLSTYTGTIPDTKASLSVGLWTLLVGLFSVFGIRRLGGRKAK